MKAQTKSSIRSFALMCIPVATLALFVTTDNAVIQVWLFLNCAAFFATFILPTTGEKSE